MNSIPATPVSISPTEQLVSGTAALQVKEKETSSAAAALQVLREVGEKRHQEKMQANEQRLRKEMRQKRTEEEFRQQVMEAELSDYCDQAEAFPKGAAGDKAFYKHLANREDFLKTSRVVNILLQRVYGDVDHLPWDMKMALERRGRENEPGIELSLSNVYLSNNQLFKMTRLMQNITSISFNDCIFDGSANCLFDPEKCKHNPDYIRNIEKPNKLFFPQIRSIQLLGRSLTLASLDEGLKGLTTARSIIALAEAHEPLAAFKQLLPMATDNDVIECTKRARSAEITAWLTREVRPYPYSLDHDKNFLIDGCPTKEIQAIWS